MKKQGLLMLTVLGLMVCLVSAPAHAQDGKISLFAGYSYGTNNFYEDDPGLNGYTAAAVWNFNKHIGLEANFSGHNGTTNVYTEMETGDPGYKDVVRQDLYTYTFGPRLSVPVGHFTLFTHILVGVTHVHQGYSEICTSSTGATESCSEVDEDGENYTTSSHGTGFAFKTGGGVDWNHGNWGVRILEVDYIRSEVPITDKEFYSGESSYTYSYQEGANDFELATGVTFTLGKSK